MRISRLLSRITMPLSMCAIGVLAISSEALADSVTFNYQGRVRVQGQAFEGTGQFKFAILNTSATATLWSNDGTLSGAPSASVPVPVSDGVFSVEIGGAGMSSLAPGIFVSDTPLRMRTWFSDGVGGFEQLNPDHKLTDLTLNAMQSGNSDYTIYVDGTNGNDGNNGLTLATAKATVGAAIDIIPSRVRCNLTVKIMPGTYREAVGLSNIAVAPGKTLKFVGDEAWTKASLGNPSVRISAASGETPATRGTGPAFEINNCPRVSLQGILFDGGTSGLDVKNSSVEVTSCKATSSSLGMAFAFATVANVYGCVADENDSIPAGGGYGYHMATGASVWLHNCAARFNTYAGLRVNHHCSVWILENSEITDNIVGGINMYSYGEVTVYPGTNTLARNGTYHISLAGLSMLRGSANLNYTGPTPSLGNTSKDTSSWIY